MVGNGRIGEQHMDKCLLAVIYTQVVSCVSLCSKLSKYSEEISGDSPDEVEANYTGNYICFCLHMPCIGFSVTLRLINKTPGIAKICVCVCV